MARRKQTLPNLFEEPINDELPFIFDDGDNVSIAFNPVQENETYTEQEVLRILDKKEKPH